MASTELPSRSQLREHVCDFILRNSFRLQPSAYKEIHPNWPGMVGLELEKFIFKRDTQDLAEVLAPVEDPHRAGSITDRLVFYAEKHGLDISLMPLSGHRMAIANIKLRTGGAVSFEPGGQFEISTKPFACLSDALSCLESSFRLVASEVLGPSEQFLQHAIQPFSRDTDAKLVISKPRYLAMDRSFLKNGLMGRRMMRRSASIQVNLDFGTSQEDLVNRYLAAQVLTPFAMAIFANSPFTEGSLSDLDSERSLAWRSIDRTRSGFPPGLSLIAKEKTMKKCAEVYTDFLLGSEDVFAQEAQPRTIGDTLQEKLKEIGWSAEIEDSIADALTLLFPEVRPKGFLELRGFDAPPPYFTSVPACFAVGLLYDKTNTEWLLEWKKDLLENEGALEGLCLEACRGLATDRFKADAKVIFKKAIEGMERLPPCFRKASSVRELLGFYELYTAQGKTPASDLRNFAREGFSPETLSLDLFTRYDAHIEARFQQK